MSRLSRALQTAGAVSLDRAAVSSSPLLPNEPRIADPGRQEVLTTQYLLPNLTQLNSCLLAIRTLVDAELKQSQPTKMGKSYPLGQCLEISQAVQKRLRTLDESMLPLEAQAGFRALSAFQQAGGAFRQVWGDLRGKYFQNAFQVGTLYIDVANDTVTPTKPKVEILPFREAEFGPIQDFSHFCRVARAYWGGEFYPNHVLPSLAPHCPLIHVIASGRVQLHDASHYMLSLSRAQKFSGSEAVLRAEPMPPRLFEHVSGLLRDAGYQAPKDAVHGQQLGLQQCREQRRKRWHLDPRFLQKAFVDARTVNSHLARRPFLIDQPSNFVKPVMQKIRIDNTDYNIDNLSHEARKQLQNLQFLDQEIARLQAHLSALQTARGAYIGALRSALPAQQA
ncbi:MAG: hypothetical protein AB1437_01865 [Pseudomonadota bacterium]